MQLQQPQNYTINTGGGTQDAFTTGMKQTASLMDMQQAYIANQQKIAQQQYQMEQEKRKREEMRVLSENPTSENVLKFMIANPEVTDQYKQSLSVLTDNEKRTAVTTAFSVVSALDAGKPELAVQQVDQQIEAAKNGNDPAALQRLEMVRNLVVASPDAARLSLKGFLYASDPVNYAKSMSEFNSDKRAEELQPSVVKKSEADARGAVSSADKAAVAAKFAESDAVMELEKKGWDIKKIQNDISVSRQNVAIAAMNARTSAANASQSNSLKAQENQIKLQELIDKRDTTVRERVAEAESTRASMDNLLNVTDKILKTPMGVVGSAAGPISSRIPTLSQSTADFEALVETAGNLVTMSNMGAMKGVLSDSDLKVLRGSQQNLSLSQSPETLISNIKELQRITLKSRKALAQKYGIPDTVPDTPNATPSGNDIDSLLKKYGQ